MRNGQNCVKGSSFHKIDKNIQRKARNKIFCMLASMMSLTPDLKLCNFVTS